MALLTDPPAGGVTNGHAGWPAIERLVPWVCLRVTLSGTLDPSSSYLRNIKDIDAAVRQRALPVLNRAASSRDDAGALGRIPALLADSLAGAWPGASLHSLELSLSPYFSVGCVTSELPMTRSSQKFEFSASHRLHNPSLDEQANRALYGKCNNPHGHGHNYELQVTLTGVPDSSGLIISPAQLESIVTEKVIRKLDHKNLNAEVEEFRQTIPSVENIARVIHGLLKPALDSGTTRLASITVWETPKTWCEYSD